MFGLGGVRGRLTATVVALVVVTALVLGIGAYAFVDVSLHESLVRDAEAQARFDLTVLIPGRLPDPSRQAFNTSGLERAFEGRNVRLIADFGDLVEPFRSIRSPELQSAVADGRLGFQWATLAPGKPVLIMAGRLPGTSATFYFLHDATALEAALAQLRLGLGGGALLLAFLGLVAARWVARGVLAPVDAAARAAERIEHGDLSARVPVASSDEFGAWAERFNRMAAALEETIRRLEASQAQNRRFVADVSHELRTPLTALVAEASILREHLGALPPDARRTGELLVSDVARLRTLVEELMELSRFDSAAEQASPEPIDLVRLVRAVAAARLPDAALVLPEEPVVVATDPRRIERILGNLLDNAREHAPNAPVEVGLQVAPDEVVLSVADGGPGVPDDRLERIFERFYKADPSRQRGSSGLGLAIAAENAALIGGSLSASNRSAGGLRFDLRIPVTEPLPGGDPAATGGPDRGARSPAQEPIR